MIKKIMVTLLCFSSFSAFSCPRAVPDNDPGFCPSFKAVAACYCLDSGLPNGLCQDMSALYKRMIAMFKSLEKACEFQKYTSKQECIDNWHCYQNGGVDSQGRACSSTQLACE